MQQRRRSAWWGPAIILCFALPVGCQAGGQSPSKPSSQTPTPKGSMGNTPLEKAPLPGGVSVLWNYQPQKVSPGTFFDYPFPESRRYDADGTISLKGFPNPRGSVASCLHPRLYLPVKLPEALFSLRKFRQYLIDSIDRSARGFGTNSAIYFRFSGALDATRLPQPETSRKWSSPVQLVNVHPGSADFGKLTPIRARVLGKSKYVQPNTLALMPIPGFPLRESQYYAAVVRRSLRDVSGKPLALNPRFERLKGSAATTAQEKLYFRTFNALKTKGIARSEIAAMTVFRTGETTAPLRRLVRRVEALDTKKANLVATYAASNYRSGVYRLVYGSYDNIEAQQGDPPYIPTADLASLSVKWDPADRRGGLIFNPIGAPRRTSDSMTWRFRRARFLMSFPAKLVAKSAQNGIISLTNVPIVIYGHGTGGNRYTFVGPTARALAELGIAVISIDAPAHGRRAMTGDLPWAVSAVLRLVGMERTALQVIRNGGLFYNVVQAHAANGNLQQAALDYAWLAAVLAKQPLTFSLDGKLVKVRFDPQRIYFFGHSQGATTGPLAVVSKHISGFFLSAAGGLMTQSALTQVGYPTAWMTRTLICDGEPQLDHPLLTLMQTFADPGDPVNYAPYFVRWKSDVGPKHIFATSSIRDRFVTPQCSAAFTTAAGMRQIGETLLPVKGQRMRGYATLPSTKGTHRVQGRLFTAVFKQYSCESYRCHYAGLSRTGGMPDWRRFFATMLKGGAPEIPQRKQLQRLYYLPGLGNP